MLLAGGFFWYWRANPEGTKEEKKQEPALANNEAFVEFFRNLDKNAKSPTASTGGSRPVGSGQPAYSSLPKAPLTSTTSPFGLPKVKFKASQKYLEFYNKTAAGLNKISEVLQGAEETLSGIGLKYSQGESYSSLTSLIAKGEEQNKALIQNTGDLKGLLSSWSLANSDTSDSNLKSATNNLILSGNSYAQSLEDFSNAFEDILLYKGVGNIGELSQKLQNAGSRVGEETAKLNGLFQEVNKILSS